MGIERLSKIVLKYAEKKDYITDSEILSFARRCYPGFNTSFKNIVISMLMQEKVIYSYNLNQYKAYGKRKDFVPYKSTIVEKQLFSYTGDKELKISYFDSSIYNSLSSLQSMKNYLFIGVESYAVNYLVDKIEKSGKKAISSNDLSKLRKLFSGIEFDFDYVVKTINEDTPLFKEKGNCFCQPRLETLLVDIVSDKTLNDLYSSEIESIYFNAFKGYAIKINRLFRYAEKKGCKDKIKSLLEYIDFDVERGEFNYD
ncbi:MAG: hypothetical protein IJ247_07070 [Bacilli bacterium]|nr:hypothetical protein [Bacilli bacterium]